jgi:hypothetical protein
MGVIMSKEFHRAIDVDGSLKSKAWDFLTKLSRDTDITGLDLKLPQGAMDRRVRTARVDLNHRAVLFAVGDAAEPMWLLTAIKPHDDGPHLRGDADRGDQPRQRRDGGTPRRSHRGEGRRVPQAPHHRGRGSGSPRSRQPSWSTWASTLDSFGCGVGEHISQRA